MSDVKVESARTELVWLWHESCFQIYRCLKMSEGDDLIGFVGRFDSKENFEEFAKEVLEMEWDSEFPKQQKN
jgi:hypothetical protein